MLYSAVWGKGGGGGGLKDQYLVERGINLGLSAVMF